MVNPFTVLGLPERFDLSLSEIDARYREVSRAGHPDRFAQDLPSVRRQAASKALEVTEAYRAVRDPIARAEALLAVQGQWVADSADSAFLFEVMELREALSSARERSDRGAVQALASQADQALREAEVRCSAAFSNEDWVAAAGALTRMRYYRRFREEASAFEEALAARN